MLKVRAKAKFDFNLRVDYSQIRTPTTFISCVILCLDFNNIFSRSGVWTANALEMLIVRKKAKFDFNLRVNISRIRTATAFISSVILRFYFSNVFSKVGA